MEELLNLSEIRDDIDKKAENVVQCLIEKNLTVAAAESCTGGLLSSAITSVPGASGVFECGIVSYSERIKCGLLGVPEQVLETCGVVSAETALSMAENVRHRAGSDIGIGITGLAGPKGDSDTLPVGTIYVGIVYGDRRFSENLGLDRYGDLGRDMNRRLAVLKALERLEEMLEIKKR